MGHALSYNFSEIGSPVRGWVEILEGVPELIIVVYGYAVRLAFQLIKNNE
jgi:hypothetical protein